MSQTPVRIKVNKTIYNIMKMTKDEKDSIGYTTYYLKKGKIEKSLVHYRKNNEFTLWGRRGGGLTQTFPNHIELIN